jgi:hypothetical protein
MSDIIRRDDRNGNVNEFIQLQAQEYIGGEIKMKEQINIAEEKNGMD